MRALLEFIEARVPGFGATLEGVGEWSVEDLERAFPAELPGVHRGFLLAMGQSGGALTEGLVDYHPSGIAELYAQAPRGMPPPHLLFLFGDPGVAPQHYYFDLDNRRGDDAEVVRLAAGVRDKEAIGRALSRRYVGLREMLAVRAMRALVLPLFAHRVERVPDPNAPPPEHPTSAEGLASLLEKCGFARLDLTRCCLLLEREGAAAEIYRSPGGSRCSIRLGAHDPKELRHLSALIGDHTELIRWPRLTP